MRGDGGGEKRGSRVREGVGSLKVRFMVNIIQESRVPRLIPSLRRPPASLEARGFLARTVNSVPRLGWCISGAFQGLVRGVAPAGAERQVRCSGGCGAPAAGELMLPELCHKRGMRIEASYIYRALYT